MKKVYSWIYNTYNDNVYILFVIVVLLVLMIFNLNYWKQKNRFMNILNFMNISSDSSDSSDSNLNKIQKDNFNNIINSTFQDTPIQIPYQPPMETNPANSLFISEEDKAKWKVASSLLDGNEDSLQNTNGISDSSQNAFLNGSSKSPQNDIMQMSSTLYGPSVNNTDKTNAIVHTENYATVGDYATLDSIGKGLTDTLGGIHTNLGYTILEEQLGTFKKQEMNNPYSYDNTSNYNSGINPSTVNGNSRGQGGYGLNSQSLQDNKPVFLQKDFDGVANIFAPNIVIQNPPLDSDGFPDISFQM